MTRLILMHLPKTAGASVRGVALRHYPAGQNIHVRPAFGRTDTTRNEAEWVETHTRFQQRERCRLVTGHARWGVHRLLPGDSEYAICLRDPEERLVSMYRWLSESRQSRSRRWVRGGFAGFLASGLADLENGMTRMLAGRADVGDERAVSPVTEADYALAVRRLESCHVVGVFDDLPGYVRRLAGRYGWEGDLSLPRVHVARSSPPLKTGGLAGLNEFDSELYRLATVRAAT